jgi:hypothetical protein
MLNGITPRNQGNYKTEIFSNLHFVHRMAIYIK